MVNRNLVALSAAGTLLSLGHMVDHVIRDDLRWSSTELLVFMIVGLVLYGAIGVSLYLYAKSKVWPAILDLLCVRRSSVRLGRAFQPVYRTTAIVHPAGL